LNRVERGLGLPIEAVQSRRALAEEHARNPGVAVVKAPDGDARALVVVQAHLDDVGILARPGVSRFTTLRYSRCDLLDIKPRRVGNAHVVDGYTDVKLGDRHVEAKVGELLHARVDVFWCLSADEVRLEADAVEGMSFGQELLCEGDVCCGLVVDRLDVVVVNVKLDIGRGGVDVVELMSVAFAGMTHGDTKVVFAKDIVPHAISVCSVVVERCGERSSPHWTSTYAR